MAAYLQRLGRLGSFKGLQVNSWVTLKNGPALWFCTQTEEPKRPVKKTKAVGKTEAPHERAALLAHRTAVSFPVRFSEPGGFLLGGTKDSITAAPVGEAASQVVQPLAEVECGNLAPEEALGSAGATQNATIASSEPQDTAAELSSSSSSSSDSDSDFDSDSEDKLNEEAKIRNASPVCADATPGETKGTYEAAGRVQHPGRRARGRSEESEKFSPEAGSGTPAYVIEDAAASLITKAHYKTPRLKVTQAQAHVEVSAEPAEAPVEVSAEPAEAPVEVSAEPAEVSAELAEAPVQVSAEPAEAPVQVSAEPADVSAELAEAPVQVSAEPADVSAEPAQAPVQDSAESQRVAAPGPVISKSIPTEAAAEAKTLSTAEDLKDPFLVSAEVPEDVSLETAAEQLEEPTAAAVEPTEPEEPFDNSTYKNYQHHSYTPYTFVDLDVDMAKYRLPQPSSGRPSPRH